MLSFDEDRHKGHAGYHLHNGLGADIASWGLADAQGQDVVVSGGEALEGKVVLDLSLIHI